MENLTVLVEWQVKSDDIATAKALLEQTYDGTRHFEGCQRYEVYENQESPGNIILLTEWTSREQFTQYVAWRQETGVLAQFGQTFAQPPQIRYFGAIA
jgi:quinol monooxygenase YgiN